MFTQGVLIFVASYSENNMINNNVMNNMNNNINMNNNNVMGQSHWVHCQKGPAEAVIPSPAEEVQPTTGAVDTVLLCHHWIRPLHINNCLVQLSYQIWPQKTTE